MLVQIVMQRKKTLTDTPRYLLGLLQHQQKAVSITNNELQFWHTHIVSLPLSWSHLDLCIVHQCIKLRHLAP